MSDPALKVLRCPTCGADLKAMNDTEIITCVYCGNSIVPVAKTQGSASAAQGATLRVEGIKTSSSALAYLELFFEDYDWDAFSYAQALSIGEIDQLAASLKASSADDKNTWLVCFQAIAVPFTHKLAGCNRILTAVIDGYKKDDPDAYSKFDAYKRVSAMITGKKDSILSTLEKITEKAARYGAAAQEVAALRENMETLKNAQLHTYPDIESIPEIHRFIEEQDAKIKQALAAKGIRADEQYTQAKTLISQNRYTEALDLLLALEGYRDSQEQALKIDKYFLIDEVLEVGGRLYYLKTEDSVKELYPTTETGRIGEQPVIQNIRKLVTNYAGILYYLSTDSKLRRFDLATNTGNRVCDGIIYSKAYYLYDYKGYFFAKQQEEDETYRLLQVDLRTGSSTTVLEGVSGVTSVHDDMLVYTVREEVSRNEYGDPTYRTNTRIFHADTREILDLGSKPLTVEGFLGTDVVFTQTAPNQHNRDLYLKSFRSNEPAQLIEANIYKFCEVVAGKLFYYVGNSASQSLISIQPDGTDRKQWQTHISQVFFDQGGWLYYVRRAGYNAVLCRSRLDGSQFRVIAAGIRDSVELKNGYLYYINDENRLMKVRLDGSNLQTLCEKVNEVLSIREDKILFTSIDDQLNEEDEDGFHTKPVISIYAVEFSGSGMRKLAYNVQTAKSYDENTVYYITGNDRPTTDDSSQPNRYLYRLDVDTNRAERLLKLQVEKSEDAGISGSTVALILACVAFFFSMLGIGAEVPALTILGLLGGIAGIVASLWLKSNKNTPQPE